ncbi:unnamed protein product [Brassica oleracea var. botrytis]
MKMVQFQDNKNQTKNCGGRQHKSDTIDCIKEHVEEKKNELLGKSLELFFWLMTKRQKTTTTFEKVRQTLIMFSFIYISLWFY